jgi:alkanesulfonate monooxygenase SsuD/methylene tetrahydromethanopterin reductase-like flavin-dependent oxidoreductase (luciferase family)
VILDMFTELQRAPRWSREGERALLEDTLAQARLADEYDYACWWTVEHHGTGEFSISSTPELFNIMVATQTRRIRIGHSGVLIPFNLNHPIRVAERAAFLDLVSNGRLEMGLARSSFREWGNFTLNGELTRPQMREVFHMLPRMWNDEKFSWTSELVSIPEINIVPKPLQRPHPPLWQMCISGESFEMAGSLGVGAIGTTLLEPIDSLANLQRRYREAFNTSPNHVSDHGNNQFGIFTFVHCTDSRDEAIRVRAAEAVLWYINNIPIAFNTPRRIVIDSLRGTFDAGAAIRGLEQGQTVDYEDWDLDDPVPVIRLLNRQMMGLALDPDEAFEVLEPMVSVIVGDPDMCIAKMRRFAAIGVDRLLCFHQFGSMGQAEVMKSIAAVGRDVIPSVRSA